MGGLGNQLLEVWHPDLFLDLAPLDHLVTVLELSSEFFLLFEDAGLEGMQVLLEELVLHAL